MVGARVVTKLSSALWIALGALVLLWRAGIGSYPFAEFYATQAVPALPSLPEAPALFQFVYNSPIGLFPAWLLGLHTELGFDLMHAAFFVAFIAACGVLAVRRWGVSVGAAIGVAFVGSQASVVCLHWLGSYDVFTVGLSSLLVVVRSRVAAAVIGFALAFAAFEQASIILGVLAVLWAVRMFEGVWVLVAAAGGLVVGRLVLGWWLGANGVEHGRRYYFDAFGADHFLEQFWRGLPLLLLTGLGASVVLLALAVWTEADLVRRLVPVALLLAMFVPVAVAEDQTRVFSILTWPLVMVMVGRFAARTDAGLLRRCLLAVLALSVVVPGVVLWKANPHLAEYHVFRVVTG